MLHECRELLTAEEIDTKLHAETVDRRSPSCACEACALSAHGPIQPGETLLRLVLSPLHVKKDKPRAAVLSHAETIGMSIFRDAYVSDAELLQAAGAIVTKMRLNMPKAGLLGVLAVPSAEPKRSRDEEGGAVVYCLYDAPDQGIEGHGDMYQTVADVPDEIRTARRQWLFSRVEAAFLPVQSFRGGLLAHLAPPA